MMMMMIMTIKILIDSSSSNLNLNLSLVSSATRCHLTSTHSPRLPEFVQSVSFQGDLFLVLPFTVMLNGHFPLAPPSFLTVCYAKHTAAMTLPYLISRSLYGHYHNHRRFESPFMPVTLPCIHYSNILEHLKILDRQSK